MDGFRSKKKRLHWEYSPLSKEEKAPILVCFPSGIPQIFSQICNYNTDSTEKDDINSSHSQIYIKANPITDFKEGFQQGLTIKNSSGKQKYVGTELSSSQSKAIKYAICKYDKSTNKIKIFDVGGSYSMMPIPVQSNNAFPQPKKNKNKNKIDIYNTSGKKRKVPPNNTSTQPDCSIVSSTTILSPSPLSSSTIISPSPLNTSSLLPPSLASTLSLQTLPCSISSTPTPSSLLSQSQSLRLPLQTSILSSQSPSPSSINQSPSPYPSLNLLSPSAMSQRTKLLSSYGSAKGKRKQMKMTMSDRVEIGNCEKELLLASYKLKTNPRLKSSLKSKKTQQ